MDHLAAAPLPTLSRYKDLFLSGKRLSVLRTLQYESLSKKVFKGLLLDFGGGNKAGYKSIVNCEHYESVNIDPKMEPTFLSTVGGALPLPDNHFDNVISMNTFEHIYDVRPLVDALYKILKPGGEFVCTTPFLYPVHAHPDDFFRPTSSWWLQTLTLAGFSEIKITPHIWGPFSTGITCSGAPGPLRKLRLHIALLMDWMYTRLRVRGESFSGKAGASLQNHALGYFIEARK